MPDLTKPISLKLERKPIPGFEGYYSVRSDGAVFSDERIVEKSNGKKMKVKERQLKKTVTVNKHGNTEKNCRYRLCVEAQKSSFSITTLMKIVFPEMYPPIKDLEGEEWRKISGHSKYMVSNKGRVKKKAEIKVSGGIQYLEQEHLRHIGLIDGYPRVCLQEDNNSNLKLVARLVFEAFHRQLNEFEQVTCKDGNHLNTHSENLIVIRIQDREKDAETGRFLKTKA